MPHAPLRRCRATRRHLQTIFLRPSSSRVAKNSRTRPCLGTSPREDRFCSGHLACAARTKRQRKKESETQTKKQRNQNSAAKAVTLGPQTPFAGRREQTEKQEEEERGEAGEGREDLGMERSALPSAASTRRPCAEPWRRQCGSVWVRWAEGEDHRRGCVHGRISLASLQGQPRAIAATPCRVNLSEPWRRQCGRVGVRWVEG